MKWYILRYAYEGRKYSCRIQAHSFEMANECAQQFVGAASILSLSECRGKKSRDGGNRTRQKDK